jgi:hypothetical protein
MHSTQENKMTVNASENNETPWRRLYWLGGVAALLSVLVYVVDISISFGGVNPAPGARAAAEWLTRLQGNPLLELRNLGLGNVISLTLGIPMFLALYTALRRASPTGAALALLLFLAGMAIYIANNAAVPMLVLSGRYAAATTEAQRSGLTAAAEAILVRGEDFTPGPFWGFFMGQTASLAISAVMLRGQVFGRAAAVTGLLGNACLVVFTLGATFAPASFNLVMGFALVGGLLCLAWLVLLARRLFQLGRDLA